MAGRYEVGRIFDTVWTGIFTKPSPLLDTKAGEKMVGQNADSFLVGRLVNIATVA